MRAVRRGLAIALAVSIPYGPLTAALLLALTAECLAGLLLLRAVRASRAAARAAAAAAVAAPVAAPVMTAVPTDPEIELVWLRRRTEPQLRHYRPSGVIAMQVRWRRAAEAAALRRRGLP